MPLSPDERRDTVISIGQLCVDGDAACAQGDVAALRDVAQRLAACSPEPLHCELLALVDVCLAEPDRGPELWPDLRDKLYRASAS